MILSAGLSPAWQQILSFDLVSMGQVNRAMHTESCASGKVLNVGRAVVSLEAEGQTLSTLGGATGQCIQDEFRRDHLPARWIETQAPTRTCITLLENRDGDRRVTELVENAQPIADHELAAFEAAFRELASNAEVVVLTGSVPPVAGGVEPSDLFASLLEPEQRSILDVRGPQLLRALERRPLVVKPNRAELEATVGRSLRDQSALTSAMHELIDAGAGWVFVTDGSRPALLTDGRRMWRLVSPPREVINPIGCGDCLAAGMAIALHGGAEVPEAVRFGTAAAIVNLSQLLPARLSLASVGAVEQDIRIEHV